MQGEKRKERKRWEGQGEVGGEGEVGRRRGGKERERWEGEGEVGRRGEREECTKQFIHERLSYKHVMHNFPHAFPLITYLSII